MDKLLVFSSMRNPPVIETERLRLRKLRVKDARDMFEYSSEPSVTEYLTWDPHSALRYTVRYLKRINEAYNDNMFYDWAIELKSKKKMIGTCGYTSFNFDNESVEVGYVLNPRYEGYGLMTEALRAVINFSLETLHFKRVEGRFMVGNRKSRSVMERCGMTFDGIQKQVLFYNK